MAEEGREEEIGLKVDLIRIVDPSAPQRGQFNEVGVLWPYQKKEIIRALIRSVANRVNVRRPYVRGLFDSCIPHPLIWHVTPARKCSTNS